MSLLAKVKELNNFSDRENFLNLVCCSDKIGLVHRKVVNLILKSKLPYFLKNNNLVLKEKRKKALNITLRNTCELLLEKKIIKDVTGENFPCVISLGKKEYFVLERALVEFLGIRGYGVHLVAYVKNNKNIKIWVPLRARTKRVEPYKLDNTVAGGISAGETVFDALYREGYEEASLSNKVLQKAVQVGTLNYSWRNKELSIRRDTLFLFELELPKNIIPKNSDGEVINFRLYNSKEIIEKIQMTSHFKKNCALVLANFFIRRGLINSKNERNYEEVSRGL